jgi:tyrosine-protein phosphatase
MLPPHPAAPTADAPDAPRLATKRRGPPAPLTLAHSKPAIASAILDSGPAVSPVTVVTVNQPDPAGARPRSVRNVKRLSLSISSANSSQHTSPSSPTAPASLAAGGAPLPPRRPSIASLPGASAATLLYNDESKTNGAPYLDGPIEIMPGIWLGSEDNARDWPGLVSCRIKAILNVAKEVVGPLDAAPTRAPDGALRNFVSTPDLQKPPTRPTGTYWHAHAPSGRPAMHYLKLAWSHGQSDLVNVGFVEGMRFVDEALVRNEGVLIQYVVPLVTPFLMTEINFPHSCQCGVSRSATMVIALVMRAAEYGGPNVPADVLALRGKGMQAAYTYVKNKSKWVGPNMSYVSSIVLQLKPPLTPPAGSSTSSWITSEHSEVDRPLTR